MSGTRAGCSRLVPSRCCSSRVQRLAVERQRPVTPPAIAAHAASTRSPASTTTSSTRASTRPTPSCSARAGPRRRTPATSSTRPPSGGASCSIPTAAPSTTSSRPPSTRAIASTEAWAAREPDDAEAQFYLGAAYAVRVQWRVLRDEKLAAARDGKRIKEALERAIALDPDLDDAYFGVGMYQYYADVAPAAAKVLRFLLMLPGGNKTEGLAQMLRARTRGRLLQGEADYQLQIIYLWYEHRTDRAVAHPRVAARPLSGQPALSRRSSPQVQDTYQHDITASLDTWRDAAGAGARAAASTSRRSPKSRARLGVARAARRALPDRSRDRAAPAGRRREARDGRSARSRRPTSRSARRRIVSVTATPRWPPTAPPSTPRPAPDPHDDPPAGRGAAHDARRTRHGPKPTGSRSTDSASSNDRDLAGRRSLARAQRRARRRRSRRALSLRPRARRLDGRMRRRSRTSS